MSFNLFSGRSRNVNKYYRCKQGRHLFNFRFVNCGSHFDVYCTAHPSLGGRDSDPHKTHLFSSGKICFVGGREPTTQSRAESLAGQWAEYFLEYRRTGVTQG